jgi:hypothetical protein
MINNNMQISNVSIYNNDSPVVIRVTAVKKQTYIYYLAC